MFLFDREALIGQIANSEEIETTLSASSVVFILCALSLLEDREAWSEMTDTEWDEIEAMVAELGNEVTQ